MNKQRVLLIGSFVTIAGIVVLYIFLGASEFAQNSEDTDAAVESVANVGNLVAAPATTRDVQGRELVDTISETFIARDSANVQILTVLEENKVVFLESGTKQVYQLDFREFFDEDVLYDLSEVVAGNIEFAIIPKSTYEEYFFLKVDGAYFIYFVDEERLSRLSDQTTYITYNELTRELYAVENGESSDSRVIKYHITPDFPNGFSVQRSEVFSFRNISKVYTSFDSVFISTSEGVYRYFEDNLFQVFEATAEPRVSFSPQSNYAILNNSEGDSFLYEFTDDEDLIIDLGESFVPSSVLWGANENIFEIQSGMLREFQFSRFLETGDEVLSMREWSISDDIVVQPFVSAIDVRDGIYFLDTESNFLRFVSRTDRFQ